jgi:hypothetical protein
MDVQFPDQTLCPFPADTWMGLGAKLPFERTVWVGYSCGSVLVQASTRGKDVTMGLSLEAAEVLRDLLCELLPKRPFGSATCHETP